MNVIREFGSLMWHHPYVSCALLVLFTPPFFPILKYFSPLLISTALFIVALVTMGPHFEGVSEQEVELRRGAEVKIWEDKRVKVQEEDGERLSKRQKSGKDPSTWSNWVKNYQQTGLAWVEHKFKNDNWRGAALNDENVSILQEAFPHRGEVMAMVLAEKSPETRSLFEAFPSRDPPRDLAISEVRELPHSVSDRSLDRPAPFSLGTDNGDLPHDYFFSYPSLPRRPELENLSFDSVMTPPIKYDMPAQLTGPAEINGVPPIKYDMPPLLTGPVEINGAEMDFVDDFDSDDEFDLQECHHDEDLYSEVGESALVPFSASHEEQSALVEGEEQPPDVSYEIYDDNFFPPADIHEGRSVPYIERQPERHLPPPLSYMQSMPPNELNKEQSYPSEHQDIPDLEEVAPFASGFHESPAAAEEFFPSSNDIYQEVAREDEHSTGRHQPNMAETTAEHTVHTQEPRTTPEPEVHIEHFEAVERTDPLPIPDLEDAPDSHEVPAAAETTIEEYYAPLESERSLPPVGIHEPLAILDRSISLPATLPKDLHDHHTIDAIVPPKVEGHEPFSDSDTDIEDDLTPERLRQQSFANIFLSGSHNNSVNSVSGDDLDSPHAEQAQRLSTTEKLPAIEAPANTIRAPPIPDSKLGQPPVVKAQRPTTEDEVSLVSNRVKGFVETGSTRRFQPDAPQLVITPPSGKPSMSPPPNKPSTLPPSKTSPILPAARRRNGAYSSSDESSGDEQIDLDSDVEIDSDSDVEGSIPVVRPGMKLRPPPKLPAKLRESLPVEQPA